MRFSRIISVVCILALTTVHVLAQKQAPPTGGEVTAGSWAWGEDLAYVQNHFMKAAEDFPEDKYSYRPTEEVRTFAEIIMHVARYNHLTAAHALGRQAEDVRQFAFHSKAEAVARLKKSFEELAEVGKQKPGSLPFDVLIHASEHYGNLVVYYRLNGLVPPASR